MIRKLQSGGVHPTRNLFVARRLAGNGLAAYRGAKRKGIEGIIAKDASSVYEEYRSTKWLKVKVHQEEEFVIAGYTRPAGSRPHFGALLLGAYKGGALHYVGKVGTGFRTPCCRRCGDSSSHSWSSSLS